VQAATTDYKTIMGEKYVGCYKDKNNRDLEKYISRSISPRDCFAKAKAMGYKYAAL